MKPEAKRGRHHGVSERLRDLQQINVDSGEAFLRAAEVMEKPELAGLFRDLALVRSAQADELGELLAAGGVDPRPKGATKEAIRRYLLDFLATLNGGDPTVIMAEAERGEEQIKKLYEGILEECEDALDDATCEVLQRQYSAVAEAFDRVRRLRNAYEGR